MYFHEEKKLITTFSDEIKKKYFQTISASDWQINSLNQHHWNFGVHAHRFDVSMYLFSVHFDAKNKILTFNLGNEEAKYIRIFPHIYYEMIGFLKNNQIDCFVRNENHLHLHHRLYKRNVLPLHSTGEKSSQSYELIHEMKEMIPSGAFYFWKDYGSIQFSTPFMPDTFWGIKCIFDKKGLIEITGKTLEQKRDVHEYFQETKEILACIQKKEREIIDYLGEIATKSYYDPFSQSLHIFKVFVPFAITYLAEKNYQVRFGKNTSTYTNLYDLGVKTKAEIKRYVELDRIRAVIEGRV